MRVVAEHRLLERERELERLESLLRRLHAGSGRVVVVTGPAGIGKSALLGVVDASARGAGVAVLRARCVEFERELAFGAVAQLFESFLRRTSRERRAQLLEGAARPVARLLGLNKRPLDGAAEVGFAAYHGLYWLCVNLTARSPLVLLVDDAHELDEESLGFLEYLARRLEGLPLLIVVAARPDAKQGGRLVWAASDCGGDVLALNVLSATAVDHVVRETLDKSPEAEFLDALRSATGGNPFLLHELLLTVHEEGVTPDAAGARSIRTLGSDRIGQAVLVRLHRLSPAAVALARAIAIVGRGGSLTVAARLADLDEASAADAVDGLVAASVLAPGGQLEFRHPVVEASIYRDMAAPARALRHRQAARLLAEIDAPPAAVAVHLLKAEPIGDPWTIDVLRSAAADASARGAPQAGIAFLERALAERSDEDVGLLLELGRAAHTALQIPKAIDALSRALRKADVAERGPVALELARTLLHVGQAEEAVALLKAQLGSADELGEELRLLLEVEYVLYAGPRLEALPTARRLRRLAGESVAELAALAAASSMTETASEAAKLASRALAEGVLVRAAEAQPAWFLAPWMLIRADRLDDAAKVVAEALDRSQTTGSHLTFARSSWLRAEIEYRKGDLLAAEAQLRNAYAAASYGGSTRVRLMAGALLVQVLADRGAFAEAAELAGGLDISQIPSHERLTRPVHYAHAYLALLSGRLDEAIAGFEQMTEKMPVARAGRSRFATGMTVHAIALRRAGRHDEAKPIAEDELVSARGWGVPRSIGIALRGWAAPNGAERVQTLEESVAVLENTPARLELAHALGDLGSTLRRDNHRAAARDPLRRALDLAAGCRADALAEHLRAELRAAGAKPRRDALRGRDALTATELRIAELAATGKTNSQIAQAIFVTPATVEKHLTSVYSKLGIASRQHLPAALSGSPQGPSPEPGNSD